MARRQKGFLSPWPQSYGWLKNLINFALIISRVDGLGKSNLGITRGRLKQSVVSWCFSQHWTLEETCRYAKDLGCGSVELVSSKNWKTLQKYRLTCAISPIAVEGRPFIKGFNNPAYHQGMGLAYRLGSERQHQAIHPRQHRRDDLHCPADSLYQIHPVP